MTNSETWERLAQRVTEIGEVPPPDDWVRDEIIVGFAREQAAQWEEGKGRPEAYIRMLRLGWCDENNSLINVGLKTAKALDAETGKIPLDKDRHRAKQLRLALEYLAKLMEDNPMISSTMRDWVEKTIAHDDKLIGAA